MGAPTRIGVIGCGFFSGNHLNSWRDLHENGAELAAVCDMDAAKAKAAAEQFGIARWYDDAAAMFAGEKLDLVDIVTQVRSHKTLVETAIGAGVATVVQKPFGNNLTECRDMVALADRTSTFLAVHENFRFQRPHLMVMDIIRSNTIGEPSWGRISFRTGHDIYAGQPYLLTEERFAITDVGVHVVDLARVFFGEAEHITAELQNRNPKARGEDTATMMLRHTAGAVSVVEVSYGAYGLPDAFPATLLEIEGERGAIRMGADHQIHVTSDGKLSHLNGDAPLLPWAERPWHIVQESVYNTCRHILERFRDGQPADVSGADNLRTYALCDAAYEAAASRRAERPIA
jgi:predicted dehydrogenase